MIYVFLANGFEEIEALTPVDILRRCELDVVTVGVGGSQVITGSHGITVAADVEESDITIGAETDMIILPGGMPGTLNLEKSPYVQKAIDFCIENDKYVAAICAAPSILGHKGLLKGKTATCFPGFENELIEADVSSELVCVYGKIITAKGAGAAMKFALKLAEITAGEKLAKKTEAALQCK